MQSSMGAVCTNSYRHDGFDDPLVDGAPRRIAGESTVFVARASGISGLRVQQQRFPQGHAQSEVGLRIPTSGP
jgi:hypothetical protein